MVMGIWTFFFRPGPGSFQGIPNMAIILSTEQISITFRGLMSVRLPWGDYDIDNDLDIC